MFDSNLFGLTKHHGPVRMDQGPAIQVQPYGTGKHALLERSTLSHKIVNGVAVGNGRNTLGDDRPLVEIFGHVVTRCSDQFHAAFVR